MTPNEPCPCRISSPQWGWNLMLASRPQYTAKVAVQSLPWLHYCMWLHLSWLDKRVSCWPWKGVLPGCERATWTGTTGPPGAKGTPAWQPARKQKSVLQLQGTEFCQQLQELGRGPSSNSNSAMPILWYYPLRPGAENPFKPYLEVWPTENVR